MTAPAPAPHRLCSETRAGCAVGDAPATGRSLPVLLAAAALGVKLPYRFAGRVRVMLLAGRHVEQATCPREAWMQDVHWANGLQVPLVALDLGL